MKPIRALRLVLLLGACSSTSVGNPPRSSVEIQLTAFDSQPAAKPARQAAGVVVSRALMVVERVRLRTCDAMELEARGPYVADLLGTGIVGVAPKLQTSERCFSGVRLKFAKLEHDRIPAGAPADVVGRSIVIEGKSAGGRRFRIDADFDDEFDLNAGNAGLMLSTSGDARVFVAFASDRWLDAAALDGVPGGGDILIDRDHNQAAYEAFRNAVKGSGHLFDDENHDGHLDDSEEHEGGEHGGDRGEAGSRGEGGGGGGVSAERH